MNADELIAWAAKNIRYEPETGEFYWLLPGPRRHMDKQAGWISDKGYRVLSVAGKRMKAHRLAWVLLTGRLPVDQIDHINGVKDDNRASNLRECTNAENQQNIRPTRNKTGFTGVRRRYTTYAAQIGLNNKMIELGRFDTPEEAHEAYLKAKAIYHKFQPTVR